MNSILNSRWLSVVLILLLVLTSLAIYRLQPSLRALRQEEKALDELRERNVKTSEANIQVNLEREAKARLNYKLNDENVAFVYERKAEVVQTITAIEPNWRKWWRIYILGQQP